MGKLNIGITGTGSLIGQAIIKSIKASSWNKKTTLFGFDYFERTVGSFWVNKSFILPDILKENVTEEEWLNTIIRLLSENRIHLLFIGLDFELTPFAKHKAFIEDKSKCTIVVSDYEQIQIAHDKYRTNTWLKEHGFYCPESFIDISEAKDKIKFPCIIKPREGSRGRNVFIASNANDLSEKSTQIGNFIIQELIGTAEDEYTCGVLIFEQKIHGIIPLKRVLKDGNTVSASYSRNTPKSIYDYLEKITLSLNPFGPCNFQLRLDRNGIPKIFEINLRHSGTTYIRSLLGFNEVEFIIDYLSGKKTNSFMIKEGCVKRYYEEILLKNE